MRVRTPASDEVGTTTSESAFPPSCPAEAGRRREPFTTRVVLPLSFEKRASRHPERIGAYRVANNISAAFIVAALVLLALPLLARRECEAGALGS